MTATATPHRLRCISVKAGIVNTCPRCGHYTVTDWHWDFSRDPHPEDGPIPLMFSGEINDEFITALRDIGSNVALPCEGCG